MTFKTKLLGAVFAAVLAAPAAQASTISILNPGDSGATTDGVMFQGEPNPTQPSTGTGVFNPFVRIQTGNPGNESGFNTDHGTTGINFETKSGIWTHSVQFGSLNTVTMNSSQYYVLHLDANEPGSATSSDNQIDITELQIFVAPGSSDPEATGGGVNNTGYSGTQYDNGASAGDNALLGYSPIWSMDSAGNGDMTIVLQASICDTSGNCGSGKGDMNMFIPTALLSGAATDNFVLYSEFTNAADGFEEWSLNQCDQQGGCTPGGGGGGQGVPEPLSASLLGLGVLALHKRRRA